MKHFIISVLITLAFIPSAILFAQDGDKVETPTELPLQKMSLDFVPRDWAFNFDGTRAVIWGSQSTNSVDQFAVVDLVKMEVLVQKQLSAGVNKAAIDGKYTYLVPKSGNLIYRFDRDTLENSKRTFLEFAAQELLALPNNKIGFPAGNILLVMNPETLELEDAAETDKLNRSESPNIEFQQHYSRRSHGVQPKFALLPNNQMRLANVYLDVNTSERITPLNLPRVPVAGTNVFRKTTSGDKYYGRVLDERRISDHHGRELALFPSQHVVSHSSPIAYGLYTERINRARKPTMIFTVNRLIDGKRIGFYSLPLGNEETAYGGSIKTMQLIGEQVFLIHNQTVAKFDLPDFTEVEIGTPLYFEETQVAPINLRENAQIQIPVKGGNGQKTFELLNEYPGLSINRLTGEIAIDGPQVVDDLFENLPQNPHNSSVIRDSRFRDKALAQVKTHYKIDLPRRSFPIELPIEIAVKDEQGQSDSIRMSVVGLAPMQKIDELDAKAQAARLERMNARIKKRKPSVGGDRTAQLEARVIQLERALNQINEQLETLLNKEE